jgi:hypothetical protein
MSEMKMVDTTPLGKQITFKSFRWGMSESHGDVKECYIYGTLLVDGIDEYDTSSDKHPYFHSYLLREINKRAKQSHYMGNKTYNIEESSGGSFEVNCTGYDTEHDNLNEYFEGELGDVIEQIIDDFDVEKEKKKTYNDNLQNFLFLCFPEAKGREWHIVNHMNEDIAGKVKEIGIKDFNERLQRYADIRVEITDLNLLRVSGRNVIRGEPTPPDRFTHEDERTTGFSRIMKLCVLDLIAAHEVEYKMFGTKHDNELSKLVHRNAEIEKKVIHDAEN